MFQATTNPIRHPQIQHIARTWANTREVELIPCVLTTPSGAKYRAVGAHHTARGQLVIDARESWYEDGCPCSNKVSFFLEGVESLQFGREADDARANAQDHIATALAIEAAAQADAETARNVQARATRLELELIADADWNDAIEMMEAECTCSPDDRMPACLPCQARTKLAAIPF